MPLHLLGKKSWHVYNSDNVSRVRQDEANAQARHEAAEQRMQAEDAAYRTALLRGEDPIKPVAALPEEDNEAGTSSTRGRGTGNREPRRRRLRGEDETDQEIRFAREAVEAGEKAKKTLTASTSSTEKTRKNDVPLMDDKGHIRLFVEPAEGKHSRTVQNNGDAETEKARKRKREEDVSKMRLSDAAGYNDSMQKKPWYASNKHAKLAEAKPAQDGIVLADVQERDVWGNEDPKRRTREQNRITSSDPFAAMQQAQTQLKQKERDRLKWEEERANELQVLKREDEDRRRRRKRRHRSHGKEGDSLDGFALDAPRDDSCRDRDKHRSRRH